MKTKISFSRAAGVNNYCIDVNREGYIGTVYKDQECVIWHACSVRLESYCASTRKSAAEGLLKIIRKRKRDLVCSNCHRIRTDMQRKQKII